MRHEVFHEIFEILLALRVGVLDLIELVNEHQQVYLRPPYDQLPVPGKFRITITIGQKLLRGTLL